MTWLELRNGSYMNRKYVKSRMKDASTVERHCLLVCTPSAVATSLVRRLAAPQACQLAVALSAAHTCVFTSGKQGMPNR